MLWLAVAVPLALLFFLARERERVRIARRFVSERLRGVSNPLRALRPWLVALSLAGDTAQRGDIVVISDGEDQSTRLDDTIAKIAQRGVPVSTILVGTAAGSTIPRPEGGGNLVDDNGQVVTTYARPETLQKIAAATGGKFYANPFGEHVLDSLAASGGTMKQRDVRVPIERYQWPLALACVAMFLGSLANRGAE